MRKRIIMGDSHHYFRLSNSKFEDDELEENSDEELEEE